jgi:surface antigen
MHISLRRKKLFFAALPAILAVTWAGAQTIQVVQAATYQEQINALNSQNAQKQGTQAQLGVQAASLQDAIARLGAEIANLQTQIAATETKREETLRKIAEAEAELARQKVTLADNLKQLYVSGQMSSLEELASSKDMADFADSEQYNVSVQHKIQRTLAAIKDLQAKLADEKATLERMIANLNDMRAKVAAQQAEQARLLALNQAEQAALENQIRSNNSKVKDLERLQAEENRRAFGASRGVAGGGGYPWGNVAYPSSLVDPWGMYKRECVSYTAWKVSNSGRYMPYWGGRGNAKQWDDNARAAGMNVTSAPAPSTVAVSNAGTWGHVMWVEQVGGDGSIFVSDYNQQFDGNYRAYWIPADRVAARGLVFIHF